MVSRAYEFKVGPTGGRKNDNVLCQGGVQLGANAIFAIVFPGDEIKKTEVIEEEESDDDVKKIPAPNDTVGSPGGDIMMNPFQVKEGIDFSWPLEMGPEIFFTRKEFIEHCNTCPNKDSLINKIIGCVCKLFDIDCPERHLCTKNTRTRIHSILETFEKQREGLESIRKQRVEPGQ